MKSMNYNKKKNLPAFYSNRERGDGVCRWKSIFSGLGDVGNIGHRIRFVLI